MTSRISAAVLAAMAAAVAGGSQAHAGRFGDAQTPPPQLPVRDSPAQAQVVGTGVIRGRVTRADTGAPLRRAQIALSTGVPMGASSPLMTLTDDNGRFELKALPPARYTVTASKAGFISWQYGQRRPNEPGGAVDLAAAAELDGIDFALPRGAAIAGVIVDEQGNAVPNALVQVLRQRYVKGMRQLYSGVGSSDRTDDLGRFRVYGIPPGTYRVAASVAIPGSSSDPRAASGGSPTFYPGTASLDDAQPVTLALAQEVTGLTFATVPARVATISGVVLGSNGQPLPNILVSLGRSTAFTAGQSFAAGRPVRPDGRFSFPDLPPGEYTVSASRTGDANEIQHAFARVTLDGIDASVTLSPRRVDRVMGRIRFDGGAPPASLRPTMVRITPVAVDPLEVGMFLGQPPPSADWTFEAPGAPGMRLLRASLPAGWAIKSIRLGNVDITDTPIVYGAGNVEGIEILLTDRLTEVTGVVRGDRGQVTPDATVVLLADDPSKWGPETRFVAVARADRSGRFLHRGLPPARYVAVALEYLDPGEETSRETLDRLRSLGAGVTLVDGESTALDLSLSKVP